MWFGINVILMLMGAPTLNNLIIKKNVKNYNGEILKKHFQLQLHSLKNKIINIKWLNIYIIEANSTPELTGQFDLRHLKQSAIKLI